MHYRAQITTESLPKIELLEEVRLNRFYGVAALINAGDNPPQYQAGQSESSAGLSPSPTSSASGMESPSVSVSKGLDL